MKDISKPITLASFIWLAVLPLASSTPARADSAQAKINRARTQVALHLHSSGFSTMFKGEAYRTPYEIAKLVEVSVLPGSRAENGTTRQEITWAITGGAAGPDLGGKASMWTYPEGARREGLLLPLSDVGNVKVTHGKLTGALSSNDPLRPTESNQGVTSTRTVKQTIATQLANQGFARVADRDADMSAAGVRIRRQGDKLLFKAGRMVGGDGRVSYRFGGELDQARGIQVNRGFVRGEGWRVGAVRNGAHRRQGYPSGGRYPAHQSYGR